MKRPQPHPPHTRGTFHRRLQPLDTEKHKVSCSGFLPKTKPIEHSCSHYNAFCSITWLTCTYLRTWQHQMTTIIGTATRCRTQRRNTFAHETTPAAPAAHTRYLSSPPAATLHGKTQGFVLHLPPKTKPMQHSCGHYNAFCRVANLHVSTHMATPDDNNHAATPLRSATADSTRA